MMRRVVVTGFGMVSPLGLNVKSTWDNILAGKSGIKHTKYFDTTDFSVKISGSLPEFNPEDYIDPRDIKKMDIFIQYGMVAASEAIKHSGLMDSANEAMLARTGVVLGSGIGGLRVIEKTAIDFHMHKKKVSPFFIPSSLINLTSGYVAIKYGFTGPNHSAVTACTTGAHAIGDGARMIKYGDADVMIAGSSEGAITPIGVAGFAAAKALSTNFNDHPEKASRPWDMDRDGFVIAEGSGVVVLEELEHAKKRGATIYAEVLGYGLSGDAYHITSPHPEGRGAKSAITNALRDASLDFSKIDYINAHGTSTKMGDKIELDTVQSLFYEANPKIMMSSTKSSIGHLLGAAGSVEAIFTILAINNKIAPATINLENPEPDAVIDLVPNKPKESNIKIAMTNSFGFGGTNASLIVAEYSNSI
jgi:3-oxoacyl-[acyl-carrier-protein] synthase II